MGSEQFLDNFGSDEFLPVKYLSGFFEGVIEEGFVRFRASKLSLATATKETLLELCC
jgi:hypothetical protein